MSPSVPSELVVVVPVLDRPKNAAPLVESLAAATESVWRLVFVCTPEDYDEIEACHLLARQSSRVQVHIADWKAGPGDYARKINWAYRASREPYVFCGADDLRFHAGWDSAALNVAREFDVGVVGTNDLGNPQTISGRHSTHPLVARCYADTRGGFVGGDGEVYFEGYDHQFVDTELVETARARGCYAHVASSVVAHHHPLWGKAPMDATYEKGLREGALDRALFESRRHLWERELVPA